MNHHHYHHHYVKIFTITLAAKILMYRVCGAGFVSFCVRLKRVIYCGDEIENKYASEVLIN